MRFRSSHIDYDAETITLVFQDEHGNKCTNVYGIEFARMLSGQLRYAIDEYDAYKSTYPNGIA